MTRACTHPASAGAHPSPFARRTAHLQRPLAHRLGSIDIELTERCNNDCVHCCINLPAADAAVRRREMSTAQVEDILTQAASLGCLQVRLTGGEPLLRPDFPRLYLFARRLGLKVLIFTNARLVTSELAALLAHIPPLVPLEVSVYGMHVDSYEAVTRRPGSFQQFRHGVALLLEHGVPFVVKGVLLPPNRHETAALEAWAATIPGMNREPAYSMFFDLRCRRDDPTKNAAIRALRVTAEDGLAFITRHADRYSREMEQFRSRFMGPPGDRLFTCGAGRSVCVDAYGVAQPCMGVRAPELCVPLTDPPNQQGETLRATLSQTLRAFAGLRELRATNPAYLARCARCVLRGLCEQCPGKSWSEHGTLDTPVEHLCDAAHAQARWLGWLGKDERGWEVTQWT